MYLDLIGEETHEINISGISTKKVFKPWEQMRTPRGRPQLEWKNRAYDKELSKGDEGRNGIDKEQILRQE